MVRSVETIAGEIRAAFVANPELAAAYGLDTEKTFNQQFSRVSVEMNDTYIVAMALALAEKIQDADKDEIVRIIERNQIGAAPWYVEVAKRFQWSENTLYYLFANLITGAVEYNIDAPEDRIVTHAACVDGGEMVVIKVATGEPGELHPLTDAQFADFKNYMRRVKIAGVPMATVNLPPDIIRLEVNVYPDAGYNSSDLRQAIIDSLNKYSVSLEFNGTLLRNAVIDTIQRVSGVRDVEITLLEVEAGGQTFEIARA